MMKSNTFCDTCSEEADLEDYMIPAVSASDTNDNILLCFRCFVHKIKEHQNNCEECTDGSLH